MAKRINILVLTFSLMAICLNSFSQNSEKDDSIVFEGFKNIKMPSHYNVIKSNALPLIMGQMFMVGAGELRIQYERMLTHNQSITLGASLHYPGALWAVARRLDTTATFRQFNYIGARAVFGYRYYPLKNLDAPEGLFLGPMFSYSFLKINDKQSNDYNNINRFNAGLIAGYQVEVDPHFFIEIVAGLSYQRYWITTYDSYRDLKRVYLPTVKKDGFIFSPVHPILFFNMGYAF